MGADNHPTAGPGRIIKFSVPPGTTVGWEAAKFSNSIVTFE